jgi:hypothetical protein
MRANRQVSAGSLGALRLCSGHARRGMSAVSFNGLLTLSHAGSVGMGEGSLFPIVFGRGNPSVSVAWLGVLPRASFPRGNTNGLAVTRRRRE